MRNSIFIFLGLAFYYNLPGHEIIAVDKAHPTILNDSKISWVAEPQNTGRVYRGLTSAGYKGRDLIKRGKRA